MKNLLLSNFNVGSLIKKLSSNYAFETSDGYNGWIPYVFNTLGNTAKDYLNIFILLDGSELVKEVESEMISDILIRIGDIAKDNATTQLWISDINFYPQNINEKDYYCNEKFKLFYSQKLFDLIDQVDNINLFTLNDMVSKIGLSKFYSPKMWYLASIKYSAVGENEIKKKIEIIINRNKRKKCLVLDMDNTLWGGVIGEIGFTNIDISLRYQDFQRRIKELKEKGVILVIISKNNHDDAITAFCNQNMILKENDFILIYANWNNKAENIAMAAKKLNIGMDSMVFIDDNPIERETIRLHFPEVAVPEFPLDTSLLNDFAIDIYNQYFYNPNPVEEDHKKTLMYKDNIKREEIKLQSKDLSDYIKQLKINIYFKKAKISDVARISELSNKTNQYNTTSIRYSEKELKDIIDDKSKIIFIANVSDRIGDNGLCIVCVIRLCKEKAIIDNFFMSCRIMGRRIENVFMKYLIYKLQLMGIDVINGYYIPNGRNVPAKELFINNDFYENVISNDTIEYELDIKDYIYKIDELIEVKDNGN